MPKQNWQRLRFVAREVIRRLTGGQLPPEKEEDFVTSVVRQWGTNDGHAGLLFPDGQRWLRYVEKGGKPEVGIGEGGPASMVRPFMSSYHFSEEDLPEIIDSLNVSQSAEFTNAVGQRLRFSLNPRERQLSIQSVTEDA
jgi:hypothetical protein